jgi:nucleotide-binding universal stress UspA family protein
MNTIQTILHPTDFSESADHAFRLASSLARDHEARLVVLHVVPSSAPVASGMLVGSFSYDNPDDVDSALTDRLEAMRESHEDLAIEWRLSKGNVIDGILSTAEDVEAGLIVLGTHGRTGLQRLLMGSIAENIVRKANCSVLTVKTPITHRPAESEYAERPIAATPY